MNLIAGSSLIFLSRMTQVKKARGLHSKKIRLFSVLSIKERTDAGKMKNNINRTYKVYCLTQCRDTGLCQEAEEDYILSANKASVAD